MIASDDPQTRLGQMVSFFERNPGWVKTGPARGEVFEPTSVGLGQAIRDQMQWQIDTRRQPDNPWWMRMNKQLVNDPLTAERAVRSGTEDQLSSDGERAWATYIKRSDSILEAIGVDPASATPAALQDAWEGAGLLKRVYVDLVLKPWARKALWVAHRETLEDGRAAAKAEAQIVQAQWPEEMEFASGWASVIGLWSYFNPPTMGNQSALAQKVILPMQHPVKVAQQPWSKRVFFDFMDAIDPLYEREIEQVHAAT